MADEYGCDLCTASFDTEAELREHAEEEHRDETQTFDGEPEPGEPAEDA